ncbi:MAG TPA: aldehyde dehydrogenase family protein, partial [Polyangia bacterium]|nr:aldehyde dehydrogenase family protein [Polyangia bacterium]
MALEPVLIAGEWRQPANPTGSFKAIDPSTGKSMPESYPVSSIDDVIAAFRAADEAVAALRAAPADAIAKFLDDYAARIEAAGEALVDRAARETGLPREPRLSKVELPRTTNQLRQGAAAARERSWCMATIDTKANLRSYYGPMGGAVVVFGPNNFPFAFNSVAGGDFVAAIAAGNPVIGKANTGHPGTSKLLAELALEAARGAGLPLAMVQLLYRTPPDVGYVLVSDPHVAATGFTGSKAAGLKLKEKADRAGKPIYLEMSSTNPVFVLPRALDERGDAIAKELYDSCAMGAGQFCTRPGLAVVPKGDKGSAFVGALTAHFKAGAPGTLLGPSGATAIAAGLKELTENGARVLAGGSAVAGDRAAFEPTLLEVSAAQFLAAPHELQTEAFGTVNTVVVADDVAQMAAVADALEGNLTGCV